MIKSSKRRVQRLKVDRETVRTLAGSELAGVVGAALTRRCPLTFDFETECWCNEP